MELTHFYNDFEIRTHHFLKPQTESKFLELGLFIRLTREKHGCFFGRKSSVYLTLVPFFEATPHEVPVKQVLQSAKAYFSKRMVGLHDIVKDLNK